MRNALLIAAILLTGCATPGARSFGVEEEIRQVEARLADALNTLDDASLDTLWDDNLTFIGTDGHATTKAQRLKSVRAARGSSVRMTSTNDDVRIEILDPATAVAYVVSSWHGGPANSAQQYRATHVWKRANGAWKLITAHVSKVTS